MKQRFLILIAFSIVSLMGSHEALAGEPKLIGKFDYWSAYQMKDNKATVCYMSISAKPPATKGSKVKRGQVVLMLTHRPAEGSLDVISYTAGTKLKSSSDVLLKIGKQDFALFADADTAWARDSATDRAIAAAMRPAAKMVISGHMASGGSFTDAVSLKGFEKAYQAISKACGVNVSKGPEKSGKP